MCVRVSVHPLRFALEGKSDFPTVCRLYKRDGLVGGHVIMLDSSKETQEAAIAALKAYPGGLQVGGWFGDHERARSPNRTCRMSHLVFFSCFCVCRCGF